MTLFDVAAVLGVVAFSVGLVVVAIVVVVSVYPPTDEVPWRK